MNWQVNYAIKYIENAPGATSVKLIRDEAISISRPGYPDMIAIILSSYIINSDLVLQYHEEFPDMEFLCGYRKECVWEGGAIKYLEDNSIGWGNAGTLYSSVQKGKLREATHKDYSFSYRLIRQHRSIKSIDREFDRVFSITLVNNETFRVGMIMEYEPTVDAIRTFWDRFGPIDIAWNINPNGSPTQNALQAGIDLGCEVLKWQELRVKLSVRI